MELTIDEKAELFDRLMATASYRAERRINGARTLSMAININGDELCRKIGEYYFDKMNRKSKEERRQQYLKLKEEFEDESA